MPEATLRAKADDGVHRGDTVIAGYHDAAEVMTALAEIGVDTRGRPEAGAQAR